MYVLHIPRKFSHFTEFFFRTINSSSINFKKFKVRPQRMRVVASSPQAGGGRRMTILGMGGTSKQPPPIPSGSSPPVAQVGNFSRPRFFFESPSKFWIFFIYFFRNFITFLFNFRFPKPFT